MNKIRVLVFPCGSEVGLEIYESLKNIRFVELWGASSVPDHGEFVFKNYLDGIPFINDDSFLDKFREIVNNHNFDVIFPAMDEVAYILKKNEDFLNCTVIASDYNVTKIAMHKSDTYNTLREIIRTPYVLNNLKEIPLEAFPVFIKPDVGYGSKGTKLIENREQFNKLIEDNNGLSGKLVLEYLPGEEYTVDCFSNKNGELLFAEGRVRNRTKNGISVNTFRYEEPEFYEFAERIARVLKLKYSWFFQLKRNSEGKLTLLEIASRIGGSSSYYRVQGVNFSLLSLYSSLGYPVNIEYQPLKIIQDRSLSNSYKVKLDFNKAYIDLDDCLIVNNQINLDMMKFIALCINHNKEVNILTRHNKDPLDTLKKFKVFSLVDNVIHVKDGGPKSKYIDANSSIFIDDSYSERKEVQEELGVYTLAPDAIEIFVK